jgi:predicted DNA-binding transcriptional regulator AlpA
MTHNTSKIIVGWKDLKALGWPYSRTHTWRMMKEGKFCQNIKLGGHRNSHPVWRLQDVLQWLESYGLIIL